MLELLINPARNVDEPLRCHAAEVAKPPIHRDGILILEMFDHHVQCFHKGSAWSVIRRKPSSFQPSNHLPDLSTQYCELERSTVGAVAVWSGAVDDEQDVGWIPDEVSLVDPVVWEVDGSRQMTGCKRLGASDIQKHKWRIAAGDGCIHIPAVRFDRKKSLEVRSGPIRIRSRYFSNCQSLTWHVRHEFPPFID